MKKILAALVTVSGLALAAPASAVVVGGIDFRLTGQGIGYRFHRQYAGWSDR